MTNTLRNGALALALLGGSALLCAPAIAADLDEGDFGGTYRYIGPGAASQPEQEVVVGAAVYPDDYVAPDAAYPPPYAPQDYVAPDVGYAPPEEGYVPEDNAGVVIVAPGAALVVGGGY
jgi:hypothetical protein